jgi:thiol-disulfide isomerase/thioredoxin
MERINLGFVCSVLLLTISCNNSNTHIQPSDGYSIGGRVNGLHSGTVILVGNNEEDRTSKTIDSVKFDNDSFALKGKLEYAQMLTLVIEPGHWSLPIFVEDSSIKINADTAGSEHYDYTKYGGTVGANIKNFSITGSKSQDDWMNFQNDKDLKQFDPVFADLEKKFYAVSGKDVDAQYKVRGEMDSVRNLLQIRQMNYVEHYVNKNPSSPAGAYMLDQVYTFISDKPLGKIDSILNAFTGDAKKSSYYNTVASSQAKIKALLPGQTAPDFTLLKRDSSKFTLSSTRGQYIMIDFWASWCHPCRKAIPHWKQVYQKYHDKGFDIVSVSDDSRWKDWFKAMDAEKMPWQQVCDEFPKKNMPSRVGTLYMTQYIPFYVLLDKEGRILVYSGKEEDILQKLEQIFRS